MLPPVEPSDEETSNEDNEDIGKGKKKKDSALGKEKEKEEKYVHTSKEEGEALYVDKEDNFVKVEKGNFDKFVNVEKGSGKAVGDVEKQVSNLARERNEKEISSDFPTCEDIGESAEEELVLGKQMSMNQKHQKHKHKHKHKNNRRFIDGFAELAAPLLNLTQDLTA